MAAVVPLFVQVTEWVLPATHDSPPLGAVTAMVGATVPELIVKLLLLTSTA